MTLKKSCRNQIRGWFPRDPVLPLPIKGATINHIDKKLLAGTITVSLIILLFGAFIYSTFGTPLIWDAPNKEYPQVYIRPNGLVEATGANLSSAPISCSGNLYTFTADMELQKMVIEKSDIILDGNGFSVRIVGPGIYKNGWNLGHLDVLGVKNVTLRNLMFADTQLTFEDSSSCKAVNNNFLSIDLKNCSDTFVSENNYRWGCSVSLTDTKDCTISNSTVAFFSLTNSNNNKLLNNNMTMIKQLALQFVDSSSNLFFGNRIERTMQLLDFRGTSENNLFVGNFIQGSFNYDPVIKCGVNTFYHNNFVNVYWSSTSITVNSPNLWDNGVEGNYWNNYNGIPHIIDVNNQDRHPLTQPVDINLEPQPQF
jgi:hypothetical protein